MKSWLVKNCIFLTFSGLEMLNNQFQNISKISHFMDPFLTSKK